MEPTEARFNLDFGDDDTVCSQQEFSERSDPCLKLDSEDEEIDVVNTDDGLCNASLSNIIFEDRYVSTSTKVFVEINGFRDHVL